MKFKNYVKSLQEFLKNNPDTAEMEVVTSIDDEGNGYNAVQFEPSIAQFHSMEDPWLELVGFYEKEDKKSPALKDCNAVIIN